MIDAVSKSGADILWCCGVKEPFGNTNRLTLEDGVFDESTKQSSEERKKNSSDKRNECGKGLGERYKQPRPEKGLYEATVF